MYITYGKVFGGLRTFLCFGYFLKMEAFRSELVAGHGEHVILLIITSDWNISCREVSLVFVFILYHNGRIIREEEFSLALYLKWFWCLAYLCCGVVSELVQMWPYITKQIESRIAQFCAMAKNMWSGSALVMFIFWYILKEQSFFYIIMKFGSITRIISSFFWCFSRPIFLRSDGSCDHSTCPFISL